MRKGLLIGMVFFLLLVGMVLATKPTFHQTNQEYCQGMLSVHQWKEVTFPESFPIQNGLVSVEYDGPAAYVHIENGSIVAAGCSVVTDYDYTLVISTAAANHLVNMECPTEQYVRWKRNNGLELKGTDKETKRNVRKLNRRAKFFPWKLR